MAWQTFTYMYNRWCTSINQVVPSIKSANSSGWYVSKRSIDNNICNSIILIRIHWKFTDNNSEPNYFGVWCICESKSDLCQCIQVFISAGKTLRFFILLAVSFVFSYLDLQVYLVLIFFACRSRWEWADKECGSTKSSQQWQVQEICAHIPAYVCKCCPSLMRQVSKCNKM